MEICTLHSGELRSKPPHERRRERAREFFPAWSVYFESSGDIRRDVFLLDSGDAFEDAEGRDDKDLVRLGQRDELVGKIQEAYGISRDEADRQVKDWEKLN